jgi:hypothetical protein
MSIRHIGLSVVASLALAAAAQAQYTNGFAWRFANDFNAGVNNGDSIGRGNPAFDTLGSMVWSYEWVPAGPSLTMANPWFNGIPTIMVWDTNNSTGAANPASWARADNTGPFIQAGRLIQVPGPSDPKPLLRFTNPQPNSITVSLSDFAFIRWQGGASSPVDFVIALWDQSARVHIPLFSTTVDKPFDGDTIIVAPTIPSVFLDRNDSLIISAQGRGTALGTVVIEPNPLVTLVSGGDCVVDTNGDRVITFLDITTLLANFGNVCP